MILHVRVIMYMMFSRRRSVLASTREEIKCKCEGDGDGDGDGDGGKSDKK